MGRMSISEKSRLPADGLVAFVKRACPTCILIEEAMARVARESRSFYVVSQDDPDFPKGVPQIIDDRALDLSWLNKIEATPTLIRFDDGRETERVEAWNRDGWRRLTGISDLGEGLPSFRPG